MPGAGVSGLEDDAVSEICRPGIASSSSSVGSAGAAVADEALVRGGDGRSSEPTLEVVGGSWKCTSGPSPVAGGVSCGGFWSVPAPSFGGGFGAPMCATLPPIQPPSAPPIAAAGSASAAWPASTSRGSAWEVNSSSDLNSSMHGSSTMASIAPSVMVTAVQPLLIVWQTSASSPASTATPAVAPSVKNASTPAPAATPMAMLRTMPAMEPMVSRMLSTTWMTVLTDCSVLASMS